MTTQHPARSINGLDAVLLGWFVSFFEWFGELARFIKRVLHATFLRPFEGGEFLRQLDAVGPKSLPLIMLSGAATGVVMSLQTSQSLTRLGARAMLPAVIVFSMIKETGPIITALVFTGRVGAGIGAELGSMKVTEQIDAMESEAVDSHKFLVVTRTLACILALPLLTAAADFSGILFGWIASTVQQPLSFIKFIHQGFNGAGFSDLLPPTFKTAFFGLIVGLVASFQGMRTRGGTEGVGLSATSSVVLCSLFIILSDVVLVRVIQVIWP